MPNPLNADPTIPSYPDMSLSIPQRPMPNLEKQNSAAWLIPIITAYIGHKMGNTALGFSLGAQGMAAQAQGIEGRNAAATRDYLNQQKADLTGAEATQKASVNALNAETNAGKEARTKRQADLEYLLKTGSLPIGSDIPDDVAQNAKQEYQSALQDKRDLTEMRKEAIRAQIAASAAAKSRWEREAANPHSKTPQPAGYKVSTVDPEGNPWPDKKPHRLGWNADSQDYDIDMGDDKTASGAQGWGDDVFLKDEKRGAGSGQAATGIPPQDFGIPFMSSFHGTPAPSSGAGILNGPPPDIAIQPTIVPTDTTAAKAELKTLFETAKTRPLTDQERTRVLELKKSIGR